MLGLLRCSGQLSGSAGPLAVFFDRNRPALVLSGCQGLASPAPPHHPSQHPLGAAGMADEQLNLFGSDDEEAEQPQEAPQPAEDKRSKLAELAKRKREVLLLCRDPSIAVAVLRGPAAGPP